MPIPFVIAPAEWAGFGWFLFCWLIYSAWADRRRRHSPSHMAVYRRYHRNWLAQLTERDRSIIDTHVTSTQMRHIAFYATTTVLVLGGLVALLGAADLGSKVRSPTCRSRCRPSPRSGRSRCSSCSSSS